MQLDETLSEKIMVALLSGNNSAEAARVAGCDRSTVWRYCQDLAFTDELSRRRNEIVEATTAALVAASTAAADKLAALVHSPDERIARLASVNVLELVLKAKEKLIISVADRIGELQITYV